MARSISSSCKSMLKRLRGTGIASRARPVRSVGVSSGAIPRPAERDGVVGVFLGVNGL